MEKDEKTNQRMIAYYAKRAAEYERVYQKPERQSDLREIEALLSAAFSGDRVLEIACGTGCWTRFIAKSAAAILATDRNSDVIEMARRKDYGSCRVEFVKSDAYSLDNVPDGHTAGFHGFWLSHVPVGRVGEFLSLFHGRLRTGARVVMIDNAYVEGSSTPISRTDAEGNTYQMRTLRDGSRHEVLKNFPSESALRGALSEYATGVAVRFLEYFWIAEYRTK